MMDQKQNRNEGRRVSEKEQLRQEDIRFVIREIKRKAEEEFQRELKTMMPEERERAIDFANNML